MAVELSVIVPAVCTAREIGPTLFSIAKHLEGTPFELLVVITTEGERAAPEAVRILREKHLQGAVLQNGDNSACGAVKTGFSRAAGRYTAVVFPAETAGEALMPFLETARRTEADFVFGCQTVEEARAAERHSMSRVVAGREGSFYLKEWLKGERMPDVSAPFLETQLAKKNQMFFGEGPCRAEAFLYLCLLSARKVAQAPVVSVVHSHLMSGENQRKSFESVETMLCVWDKIRTAEKGDRELLRSFEQQKLPQIIMECVDAAITDGTSSKEVREVLKVSGYDRFLISGRETEKNLRRKIRKFYMFPAFYHPVG